MECGDDHLRDLLSKVAGQFFKDLPERHYFELEILVVAGSEPAAEDRIGGDRPDHHDHLREDDKVGAEREDEPEDGLRSAARAGAVRG